MRVLGTLGILLVTLSGTDLGAQTATVTSYGTPCPLQAGQPWTPLAMATRGLPRIGTTFEVTGISPRRSCGLLACPRRPCTLCNRCSGPDFLLLGGSRSNRTVNLPGLFGDGCPVLASPDVVLTGDPGGVVALPIPNRVGLIGVQFNLQEVSLLTWSTIGSGCAQETVVLAGVRLSDGVECVIGM